MKGSAKDKALVLVTGDVITDHHIYKGERDAPRAKDVFGTMVTETHGGAKLLHEIISKVAEATNNDLPEDEAGYAVQFGLKIDTNLKLPSDHNSYALWSPCAKEKDSKKLVWRMTEPMGYGSKTSSSGHCQDRPHVPGDPATNIIVIDDGALSFRFCAHEKGWPELIDKDNNQLKWVVLKMSSPVAQGDLWRTLSDIVGQKLVVIVSVGDLRREEAGITKGLSWERTIEELLSELKLNATIHDLLKARHLIITFGSDGALWINNADGDRDCHLIYDPSNIEGEWAEKYTGRAFGYLSCFTAGVVSELARPEDKADIGKGIMAGLSAMRELHLEGHGEVGGSAPEFPFAKVAEIIRGPIKGYYKAQVPFFYGVANSFASSWTIMAGNNKINESSKPLYGLARRVAIFGVKALANAPYARFGKLLTVDRREIESLRGIQRLVKNYYGKGKSSRPLSIAVFGPPGSGKSFAIKQIAEGVIGKEKPLEFNLSQFTKSENLIEAFHQVRDKAIKGTMPFVFWDEFDSKKYEWLQYLLAPMQDGEFREGQISHPIGKCVFVFAGATSFTMESFGPQDKQSEDYKEFKMRKGPDFVSRLSGYLNVLGPNPRQKFDKENNKWVNDDAPADISFPVRRALLLRANLGLKQDEKLEIDKGLLSAFLENKEFTHGARSMETIALLAQGAKKSSLRRSDLPPQEQMSLHVEYGEFMDIIKRDLPFKLNAEKLAHDIHEVFRSANRGNENDKDYKDLSENIKDSNIKAASRIPEVLSHASLLVQPAKPEGGPDSLSDEEIEKAIEGHIETLAEAEHDGWMEEKYQNGYVYGPQKDEKKRTHNLLIPYSALPDSEKQKDRDHVRSYPDIVKKVGFKIIHNR